MRARLIFGILTCLLTIRVAPAVGRWLGPLEKLCRDNDLVVVVRLLDATEVPAKEVETLDKLIYLPGFVRQDLVLKRCRFRIVEVLRNNIGEKPGDTMTAVANFDPPCDPNEDRTTYTGLAVYFSRDRNYVLIISRLAKDKDYYVSANSQFTMTASPATVERVRTAANPEKWEWSKPVNGLSIAMNIHSSEYNNDIYVLAVLAIRNQARETIQFDVTDRSAIIEARDSNGRSVRSECEGSVDGFSPLTASTDPNSAPYAGLPGPVKPVRAAIKAGEILFIRDASFMFVSDGDLRGVWDVPKAKDPKLWSGKITTERIKITGPSKRPKEAG